jgi:hypothetical protein
MAPPLRQHLGHGAFDVDRRRVEERQAGGFRAAQASRRRIAVRSLVSDPNR